MNNGNVNYGSRNDRELEEIGALETGIASVAARFKGKNEFNYSHRTEIAAHLMSQVQDAFRSVEPVENISAPANLIRMHWYCLRPGPSVDPA